MIKSFKQRVCVLSYDMCERLCAITAEEAQLLVDAGVAVAVDEPWKYFIGAIELLISDDQFREHLNGTTKPKGRPKPPMRAPGSSTGDAGRGLGPLIGSHRVLHYGPGIRVR